MFTMEERARAIEQLRAEALDDLDRSGCTCEPRMSLTERGYGSENLPMWESEHTDDCALTLSAGDPERGLVVGSSITNRSGMKWLPTVLRAAADATPLDLPAEDRERVYSENVDRLIQARQRDGLSVPDGRHRHNATHKN